MNILSLDVEYNQPSQKTIQIGAAVFKAKTGQMLDKLELYVNPGEPIADRIVELTCITDNDVKNALSIKEAFAELERMHKKYRCFMNPLVWGSGTRNDSDMIYKEADPRNQDGQSIPNFMGFRVLDAKTIYQSIQMYNNNTVRGGLANACDKLGIGFEGRPHTALADAVNTFRVWHCLVKKFPMKLE